MHLLYIFIIMLLFSIFFMFLWSILAAKKDPERQYLEDCEQEKWLHEYRRRNH